MPTLQSHTDYQGAQGRSTIQSLSKSVFFPTLKNEKKVEHENTTEAVAQPPKQIKNESVDSPMRAHFFSSDFIRQKLSALVVFV